MRKLLENRRDKTQPCLTPFITTTKIREAAITSISHTLINIIIYDYIIRKGYVLFQYPSLYSWEW